MTTKGSATEPIPFEHYAAAEMLEGVTLENGWKVAERVPKANAGTGGCFSVPYFVERMEGKQLKRAFLKALNLSVIVEEPDFTRALERHTHAFNFEIDTLELCKGKNLDRIARLLDSGKYKSPKSPYPVAYIIFELADGGDARHQLEKWGRFNLAWTLRTLHQVAVGVQQLHGHGIAHQDLKPSNILFFESFGAKLADLGCADLEGKASMSPRGHVRVAGDRNYAPPELLYGEVAPDWRRRRLGCDLYLMGNLTVFFFTGGASMTASQLRNTHVNHKPGTWQGNYRDAMPYVRKAFEDALEIIKKDIPEGVRVEVGEILRWLCEPDPEKRGHPVDTKRSQQNLGSQFNLERMISAFDLLATRAEHRLIKG